MGSGVSTEAGAAKVKEIIPPWVYTVKIPPESSSDKLGACSDGMAHVGPNTVTRNRAGHQDTDGVRWSRGFTSGKHTFEIVFPMAHRGYQATVGVGTEEAPLHAKGRVPLVGSNKHSWGICLRGRNAFHKGNVVRPYPVTQQFLPDKFYMYVDADAGTLQFGSDLDYYGTALSAIPRAQPLYPIVSASIQGATITVVYRGMGDASLIGPPPPCVVPAAPQMMHPAIVARKDPPPPPPPTVNSNTHPSDKREAITGQKIEEHLEKIQEQGGNSRAEKHERGDNKEEEKKESKQPTPAPAPAPAEEKKEETEAGTSEKTEAKKDEPEPEAEAQKDEEKAEVKQEEAEVKEGEAEVKKDESEPETGVKLVAEAEAEAEKASPASDEGFADGKNTAELTEVAA